MGKKYIIEIGRLERLYKAFVSAHGKPNMTWLSPEVDLTPYTEPDLEQVKDEAYNDGYKAGREAEKVRQPDLEQVRKEAYDKGFDDGRNKCQSREYCMNESYQQGLADAWEAARKIASYDAGQNYVIFGRHFTNVTLNTFTASEAIEKIRQYEQKQEEQIQVGDEVGYYGVADEHGNVNYSGVVLEIREEDYLVMEKDGKTYPLKKKFVLTKTGRHFPEIASVLEKMRGEQDG